jgi:DNA-binding PadR family transcriptional regulator
LATKHAVLGILADRPSYGYELVHRLNLRLGPAWQLSASTVYAALEQLEHDRLISAVERVGEDRRGADRRVLRRVVYEVTAAGLESLRAWMGEPSFRPEPVRSELALKIAVSRSDDAPAILDAVEQAGRIVAIARGECLAAAEAASGRPWSDTTAALLAAGTVGRLDGELRWLELVRRSLGALRAPSPGYAGRGAPAG